jgi:hypothetical protein
MEAIGSSVTWVTIYQTARCHVPVRLSNVDLLRSSWFISGTNWNFIYHSIELYVSVFSSSSSLLPLLEHRADFSVSWSFTDGRTPWTGDQLVTKIFQLGFAYLTSEVRSQFASGRSWDRPTRSTFSAVFLSPRTNAELTQMPRCTAFASHAALPSVTPTFRPNVALPMLDQISL